MSKKYSISTKQAILAGLGITALLTGIGIAVFSSRKKKKNKAGDKTGTKGKPGTTRTIMT